MVKYGLRALKPVSNHKYHQRVLSRLKVSNQIKKLYIEKFTFISINCIRNFQNVSSSQVAAQAMKASKSTFCTHKTTTQS